MRKKILSVLLVLSMCLSMLPTWAATPDAADATGLCPHHTTHTEECGYVEATGGQPCGHEPTEECKYIEDGEGIQCTHVHDEICGYAEAVEGSSCTNICDICNAQAETVPEKVEEPEETVDVEDSEGKNELGNGSDTSVAETIVSVDEADIKTNILNRIREGSFDPFSSDMTLEEFYALMELFQEGSLLLKGTHIASAPVGAYDAPGVEDPGVEEPATDEGGKYIPRRMFMFGGLSGYNGDKDKPLGYDNENGGGTDADDVERKNYPAGLANYGEDYLRPPMDWQGVKLKNMEAVVIVPGKNDNDATISGDVDQSLFLSYEGYYVRRVTIQNYEATVLGAIRLPNGDNGYTYVYYYQTASTTGTEVSTTTLNDNQKFIVEYVPLEHHMRYVVEMRDKGALPNGAESTGDGTTGNDAYMALLDSIFGVDRPTGTTDGYYSFIATAPYGYTLRIFREVKGSDAGREEITGPSSPTKVLHNEGYPLGAEPVYKYPKTGMRIIPDTDKGPSEMRRSDTFYNANLTADRTIIAVLEKKEAPVFDVQTIITNSSGTANRGSSAVRKVTATDKKTGTKASIPYDYEDEYLWRRDGDNGSSKYKEYDNKDAIGNIQTSDSWGWVNNKNNSVNQSTMDREADGTYSYQWTFQTNSSDEFLLDVMEFNGVAMKIPYFPKYSAKGDATGTKKGVDAWFTEMTLPDGAQIRLEFLMTFQGNNAQRVYRVTVTNARTNVTVTGMNLMQYSSGAPEISVYDLVGINAGDGTQDAAIEYYKGDTQSWTKETVSNVIVNKDSEGIDYNGDSTKHNANIRFKLNDGYGSPYFLFESSQKGIINDQASASRRDADGEIDLDGVKPLESIPETGSLASNRVYGPDEEGWYYIHLSGQGDKKMALLTIGAREVRYVIRYLPGYLKDTSGESENALGWDKLEGISPEELIDSRGNYIGIVKNPNSTPKFGHYAGLCHPSFFWENTENGIPGEQYDDFNGRYYDTVSDKTALVPLTAESRPVDPDGGYQFVDWILVNQDFKPVTDGAGNEFHFFANPIDIATINDYAILNEGLGGAEKDVMVLRLMPTWREITNPFHYNVKLNWVDAQGDLHADYYSDWNQGLTDWNIENGKLTVKVLTNSTLLLNWIAQHPTYSFWDDVNNALDDADYDKDNPENSTGKSAEQKIAAALDEYIPELAVESMKDKRQMILNELLKTDISGVSSTEEKEPGDDSENNPEGNPEEDSTKNDKPNGTVDFIRLGNYAYQVCEDHATISIWMYENKGGLVFHKTVDPAPYIADDEFYFTVNDVTVPLDDIGEGKEEKAEAKLTGIYKAYPEVVYDVGGNKRERLDSDAWLVQFVDGKMVNVVKNDGSAWPSPEVPYFSLSDGDGIMLYVPSGQYTLTELGSKSGGTYEVSTTYSIGGVITEPDQDSGWNLPKDEILSGSRTEMDETAQNEQVEVTVNFETGEKNVVQTITFINKTEVLYITKDVLGQDASQAKDTFTFEVQFTLPPGKTPLTDGNENYYFNVNVYDRDTNTGTYTQKAQDGQTKISLTQGTESIWSGTITIKGKQRAAIVMDPKLGDVNYTVTERPDMGDGWTLDSSSNTSGIIKGTTPGEAVFVNSYLAPGLHITETIYGGNAILNEKFEFTLTLYMDPDCTEKLEYNQDGFNGGEITFSLGNGEVKSFTFEDLNTTYYYKVVEATKDNFYNFYTGEFGELRAGDTAVASFTNVQLVDVVISKTVAGEDVDPDQEFDFTATFTYNGVNYTPDPSNMVGGTFTLKHGDSITVKAPYGTQYTVAESANENYSPSITRTETTGSRPEVSETFNGGTLSDTLRADMTELTYTNTHIVQRASLTISKTVEGNMGNRTKPFTFAVTLTDSSGAPVSGEFSISGKAIVEGGKITFDENGEATVQLTHGQSITIEELPLGTKYIITETPDGYQASYKINDGSETNQTTAKGILKEDTEVKYTNKLSAGVPTDSTMEYRWLIPLFLLVSAGITWLLYKRRRRT